MDKTAIQKLNLKNAKILYNNKGEPEYALVPLKKSPRKKVYNLTEKDITSAVDEIREKLFNELYATKIKNIS